MSKFPYPGKIFADAGD